MNNSNKLVLKYPAAWHGDMWREALPCGNGTVGAAVLGSIKQETVIINHSMLWHWGKKDELPDVSGRLDETRALMEQKRFLEASWHLTNALKECGYGTTLESPMPLADLKVTMPAKRVLKTTVANWIWKQAKLPWPGRTRIMSTKDRFSFQGRMTLLFTE